MKNKKKEEKKSAKYSKEINNKRIQMRKMNVLLKKSNYYNPIITVVPEDYKPECQVVDYGSAPEPENTKNNYNASETIGVDEREYFADDGDEDFDTMSLDEV